MLRCAGTRELLLNEVNSSLIERWERWLRQRNVSLNTISCYMRSMRAIYNKVEKTSSMIPHNNPFIHAYTGYARTRKRSIGLDDIRALRTANLRQGSPQAYARDIFLFSIYALGMPFIDIAFLRKSQVCNGFICYQRHKTHQPIHIRIEPCMQEIIDRYQTHISDYVFPFITETNPKSAYKQYKTHLRSYNRHLQQLAQKVGLQGQLSSYTVRHTWASIAYQRGIELPVISKALGHTNPQTTQIYIRELANDCIAKVNKQLLQCMFETE